MRNLIIFCLLLLPNSLFADFPNAIQSVCKMYNHKNEGRGSAVAFREDEKYVWLLTAGHVVKDNPWLYAYFYINGKEQPAVVAKIHKINYNAEDTLANEMLHDIAVMTIEKAWFKKQPIPPVIPIAYENAKKEDVIFSVGCPNMAWPCGFIGHIYNTTENIMSFYPNPEGGRSGSPIFDAKGEHIVGIVLWQTNSGGRGITIKAIEELEVFEREE